MCKLMLICITYVPYIKKHNSLYTVIKKNQGIEINAKCQYWFLSQNMMLHFCFQQSFAKKSHIIS